MSVEIVGKNNRFHGAQVELERRDKWQVSVREEYAQKRATAIDRAKRFPTLSKVSLFHLANRVHSVLRNLKLLEHRVAN